MKKMTFKQYRRALDKLDLSVSGGATGAHQLFGVAPRTSRRWAGDEAPIHPAAERLIVVMIKHKLTPEYVMDLELTAEDLK